MVTQTEKIVCACLLLRDGSVILVPRGKLPMDVFNHADKFSPYVRNMTVNGTFFVTTLGEVVDGVAARRIAIHAAQIDETDNPTELVAIDLLKMRL